MSKIAQGPGGLNQYPSSQDDNFYRHNPSDPHRNLTDRKLPRHEDLVAKSRQSQAKGASGIGHNDQSFNESMADHGHAPKVFESVLRSKKTDSKEHESPANRPNNAQ